MLLKFADLAMMDGTQNQFEGAIALGRATMVAVAAIECQRRRIRTLPLLAGSDELHVPLRGLTAWYERLCEDCDYATPPPAEGLEALPRVAQHITGSARKEIGTAWWAVRVAQEVVACRQLLGSQDHANGSSFELALSRLETAMYGWQEHSSKATA